MKIPQLKKKPEIKSCHNISWEDNYSWIHQNNILEVLKDSSKLLPEVKKYLEEENSYTEFHLTDTKNIQKKLSFEMEKSSKKMDYEKAATYRDRIKALTQIQSSQHISSINLDNADVISISQEAGKSCIQVFFYRSKQNWGNQSYFPSHDQSHTAEEVLTSFITQFYENKNVPAEILLNKKINDLNLINLPSKKKKKNLYP